VAEGERLDGTAVAGVYADMVVLVSDGREEQLWLSFVRDTQALTSARGPRSRKAAAADGIPADRFGGRRVGDNRWVYRREGLMAYYQELLDHPQRLLKVFDSMRPVYEDGGRISGYQLHVEGEPEFFSSVGLRENDIVRSVNSLKMTSRRRAEFFIEQFVKGRANVFSMEVERDGKTAKNVYEVR
jgi:type II secretion system protein C